MPRAELSKRSTYKVAHAQKTLNMDKVYPAITKTSLDEGVNHQGAGLLPKEDAPHNDGGAPEDVVEDPQDIVDQPDSFGQMMVNFQQLQNVIGE